MNESQKQVKAEYRKPSSLSTHKSLLVKRHVLKAQCKSIGLFA